MEAGGRNRDMTLEVPRWGVLKGLLVWTYWALLCASYGRERSLLRSLLISLLGHKTVNAFTPLVCGFVVTGLCVCVHVHICPWAWLRVHPCFAGSSVYS